jgi:hypothetical protein
MRTRDFNAPRAKKWDDAPTMQNVTTDVVERTAAKE